VELDQINLVDLQTLQRFVELHRRGPRILAVELGHRKTFWRYPSRSALPMRISLSPPAVVPRIFHEVDSVIYRGADDPLAFLLGDARRADMSTSQADNRNPFTSVTKRAIFCPNG
jgi:hypothetical protein